MWQTEVPEAVRAVEVSRQYPDDEVAIVVQRTGVSRDTANLVLRELDDLRRAKCDA